MLFTAEQQLQVLRLVLALAASQPPTTAPPPTTTTTPPTTPAAPPPTVTTVSPKPEPKPEPTLSPAEVFVISDSDSDRSGDEGSDDEDHNHDHDATRSLNRARALTRARSRKRYHALFQRIARCGIADALGERQWQAFKRFVRRHFLRAFLDLFDPADHVLRCCGPLDGGCCPHRFVVDLAGPERVDFRLAGLHLDHEYDVRHICEAWRRAMPANPRRWDDGVNGLRLAHLLFGVQPLGAWPARVRLRCGNNRYYGAGDQDHDDFCHTTDVAHYSRVLAPADLAGARAV